MSMVTMSTPLIAASVILLLGACWQGAATCAEGRVASCHDRFAALGAGGLVGLLAARDRVVSERVIVL